MPFPVAFLGSTTLGTCSSPPTTVVGSCSPNVFVNGSAVAIIGAQIIPHKRYHDKHPHGGMVCVGSPNVFVNGSAMAMALSPMPNITCGDTIGVGSPNTYVN